MLQLDLHPSRYLLGVLLLSHIIVMLVLLHLPIKWWAIILVECCIVGSFIHSVRRYISRHSLTSVIKVWCDQYGQWHLLNRANQQQRVNLLGDSINSSYLVLLNFRSIEDKKKQSVLIFKDAVSPSDFRRLRRLLNRIKLT